MKNATETIPVFYIKKNHKMVKFMIKMVILSKQLLF